MDLALLLDVPDAEEDVGFHGVQLRVALPHGRQVMNLEDVQLRLQLHQGAFLFGERLLQGRKLGELAAELALLRSGLRKL